MEYRPVGGFCGGCGAPLRPAEPYTWREIAALEQVSRTGGATTRLRQKVYTGRVFCNACALDDDRQPTLFEEGE